jgi:hypothetical protein
MDRKRWIMLIAGIGVVAAAVVIGLVVSGNDSPSKAEAASTLCGSLKTLEGSVKNLTGLDKSTATKSDYESAVSAVQNDWKQVKSDAQDVQDASTGDLDSAWNDFTSAVKNVPNDASASDALNDVTQSAQALDSAAQSTAQQMSCS